MTDPTTSAGGEPPANETATKPKRGDKPDKPAAAAAAPVKQFPPGFEIFLALQQHDQIKPDDRIQPQHGALVSAYLGLTIEDSPAWTPAEAREHVLLLRDTNPMAWGAARQQDTVRFCKIQRASGKEDCPTPEDLRSAMSNILIAATAAA